MQKSVSRPRKRVLTPIGLPKKPRDLAQASKSAITRRHVYAAQLKLLETYAAEQGIEPFPASPRAVANWLADRAAAAQPLATLRTALAAVAAGQKAQGWYLDTKAPEITNVLKGVGRVHASGQKQADPIRSEDVVELLRALGEPSIERRDAALIATGYCFGLRRSELVRLDFDRLGTGDGFIRITDETIDLIMVRFKTIRAGGSAEVTIPRSEVAMAVSAIESWIAHAGIKPGNALLTSVEQGGQIGARLTDQSVNSIIKARIV